MATYYTSSSNQKDGSPVSYTEAAVLPGSSMMYMNSGAFSEGFASNAPLHGNIVGMQSVEASNSTSHQEILSKFVGTRGFEHDFGAWRDGGRNEMLLMHPSMGGQPPSILQGQGLSLSLGTQIPGGIQLPSMPYRNPNTGFTSFLNPTSSIGNESSSRNGFSSEENSRLAEYFPPGFSAQDPNKGDLSGYGMASVSNSKYLKAAQQLLDEVVNVRKGLKRPTGEIRDQQMKSSKESQEGSKNVSSNPQESDKKSSELSCSERQELQSKLTKLMSMLDEVDRKYKQYYQQMQFVVSSFDVIAGYGAAKPYTALALQTISRHFRCLHDAINGQIRSIHKSLGEQDGSENGKGERITRLRFVDQHLRQQRALQQLGMMNQNAWRPQRGLPESSVTILRAWLFEHFLNPYPKDSDKTMLARQTGLTRSQVSNWFINARVRLWKPMIEDMYKEEFADAELDSNSVSDNAAKTKKGGEGLQQSESSTGTERGSTGKMVDSKPDNATDAEMAGSNAGTSFQNTQAEIEVDYGLAKMTEGPRSNLDDSTLFPAGYAHSDGNAADRYMAAAAAAYHMSEFGRFGGASGSGISLTLGLQNYEGSSSSLPMPGGTHHHQSFIPMRDDAMYNTQETSSVGAETTDFESMNPENRQQRFSSSHLFHDFVA